MFGRDLNRPLRGRQIFFFYQIEEKKEKKGSTTFELLFHHTRVTFTFSSFSMNICTRLYLLTSVFCSCVRVFVYVCASVRKHIMTALFY